RLSRYAPEITIKDEVNARHFIRALKPRTSEQLAAFQIKTFQEALSRSFSIEREEENRTSEQARRLRQMPPQFLARQDPTKRQMTSLPSQTFVRPVGQPWELGSASRPVPSSNIQSTSSNARPDTIRFQGQSL
ncbi:hypothetical protein MKW92_017381, partial [Papaver armeniacum]